MVLEKWLAEGLILAVESRISCQKLELVKENLIQEYVNKYNLL